MSKAIPSVFNATVNLPNGGATINTFVDSFTECLAGGITTASYHAASYSGLSIEVSECCAACLGQGCLRMPKSQFKTKVCRACRGHLGPLKTITIPFVVHENVKLVDA